MSIGSSYDTSSPDVEQPENPELIVVGANERLEIPAAELIENPELLSHIHERLVTADAPSVIVLRRFFDWPIDARTALLQLLAETQSPYQLAVDDESRVFTDPLEAVLATLPDTDHVAQRADARRLSVFAAAMFHPAALNEACGRVAERLRELLHSNVRTDRLQREARQWVESISDSRESNPYVLDILHDAPAPEDACIPAGWDVSASGIGRRGSSQLAIPALVLITGRLRDINSGVESVRLDWLRDGQWHWRIEEKRTIADQRKIVDLSAWGIPVTSNNASDLVQFLADYEAVNCDVIPVAQSTRQLGWHGDDRFLVGRQLITSDGLDNANVQAVPPQEWPQNALFFQGADEGNDQLVDGFHCCGREDAWYEAISVLAE